MKRLHLHVRALGQVLLRDPVSVAREAYFALEDAVPGPGAEPACHAPAAPAAPAACGAWEWTPGCCA